MSKKKMSGWVYVLTNPALPGLVKIGCTKFDPGVRLKQHNAALEMAALPDFELVQSFQAEDHQALEAAVHAELWEAQEPYRRELFKVPVATALAVIEKRIAAGVPKRAKAPKAEVAVCLSLYEWMEENFDALYAAMWSHKSDACMSEVALKYQAAYPNSGKPLLTASGVRSTWWRVMKKVAKSRRSTERTLRRAAA